MKSIKIFAVASAIALLGTAGFTSCNQKNGPEAPENYNGDVVKTQFTISIPEAGKPNAAAAPGVLRMPAANTQETGFLGMEKIVLMPFNVTTDKVQSDATRLGNIISLSTLGGDIAPSGEEGSVSTSDAKYKVYSNVSIPLGTNKFLFYARGKQPTSPSEDEKFEFGQLTANNTENNTTKNPSNITFDLVAIPLTKGGSIASTTIEAAMTNYLNSIANANDGSEAEGHTWATHANTEIKKMYTSFTGLRAGSAMSILKTVEDLYNSLELYNDAWKASHSEDDAVVKAVMTAILGNNDPDAAGRMIQITTASAGDNVFAWDEDASFKDYPRDFNHPDGSVSVQWNTNHFEYVHDFSYGSLNVSDPSKYVYPACIYYYANSGLETSTKKESTNYEDKDWEHILSDVYTEDVYVVGTSTRSVAIIDRIQYGVARLKTSVVAASTPIKDQKEVVNNLEGTVAINNLTMTAVLVGGQGTVRYDFTTGTTGSQIVYDCKLPTDGDWILKTSSPSVNPTLVLESPVGQPVRMAVEFVNNGPDFFGEGGNLIPRGTRFYVVGELSASTKTAAKNIDRVFKQDYTTYAQFKINNLQHAYNVVPDLRTESLELGFSVDLAWEEGNTYDVIIQ
ncbi:MAG: hypothetical protein E7074_02680 [Bacteroidales bacterium]|jgi:hypothetical protein|nr:hypothetical protein [Bacteroidales bacterium]